MDPTPFPDDYCNLKKSNVDFEVSVENNKYIYVFLHSAHSAIYRNGKIWRNSIGDKFILALAQELDDTRSLLKQTQFVLGIVMANKNNGKSLLRELSDEGLKIIEDSKKLLHETRRDP